MKIVYMGTPDFAVRPLQLLLEEGHEVVAVVTSPDKPAGRGRKVRMSAVKEFALEKNLNILQPPKLRDSDFIDRLQNLNADVFVVVAFRMLPEAVWKIPPKGTINIHASLLPQYRGAAPINHAIINGDEISGVTSFFIREEIDTGEIILQDFAEISSDMNAGELHDMLMEKGAVLLLRTLEKIKKGIVVPIPQEKLLKNAQFTLKPAPKIFREDCKLEWNDKAENIHNRVRGLSPFPGSYTILNNDEGESTDIKIFKTNISDAPCDENAGQIWTDNKKFLRIATNNKWLDILELQQKGKSRMQVDAFLRGFRINNKWFCS